MLISGNEVHVGKEVVEIGKSFLVGQCGRIEHSRKWVIDDSAYNSN